jgi:hypothetical protein
MTESLLFAIGKKFSDKINRKAILNGLCAHYIMTVAAVKCVYTLLMRAYDTQRTNFMLSAKKRGTRMV